MDYGHPVRFGTVSADHLTPESAAAPPSRVRRGAAADFAGAP